MNRVIKATIVVSIIRIFDMITTYFGIKKLGLEAEGNIIIREIIERADSLVFGLITHYIITAGLTYLLFLFIDWIDKRARKGKPRPFDVGFVLAIVLFSLLPIWNILNIYII